MDTISNLIFDVKEKLTDAEYMKMMETLKETREVKKDMYKIWYLIPDVEGDWDEECELSIGVKLKSAYAQISERRSVEIENTLEVKGYYTMLEQSIKELTGRSNGREGTKIRVCRYGENNDLTISYNIINVNITKIKKLV